MSQSAQQAVEAELLKTRALAYKRNVLVLATVLSAIYLIPGIDFRGLSFFGVSMGATAWHRTVVLGALWVLLIYSALSFGYHAYWDFRVWRDNVVKNAPEGGAPMRYFPELGMFFGRPPGQPRSVSRWVGDKTQIVGWEEREDQHKDNIMWVPKVVEGKSVHKDIRFVLSKTLVHRIRERIRTFVALDLVIPAVPLVVAAMLAMVDVSRPIAAAALHLFQ
jgi:hypothetical protein